MPNRIIKESIRTSETVASLTDFEFRLWIGLIVSADDAGRGDARPAIIKGTVFPLRDRVTAKDIGAALHGLAAKGCVSLYEVDGKPYFWFPTWKDHQRIRDCKPRFPEPPAETQSAAICGELPQVAASCGEARPDARAPAESESESEYEYESKRDRRAAARETPPTLEEIVAYCKERKSPVDPRKFYDYFQAGGWRDAKGQPVRSWKQKLLTWEKYDTGRRPAPQGQAASPVRSPEEAAADHERMARMMAALEAK